MASSGTLPPKQKKAIAAIMSCDTFAHAAKAAGVGERTLHRWMKDSAFTAGLREAQDRAIDGAIARLSGEARAAANVLVEIAVDPSTPAAVRVQSAGRLLALLLDFRSHKELVERVEELERKAGEADVVERQGRQTRTGVRGEVAVLPAMQHRN